MGQDEVLAGQLRQQIDQYKQQIDAQAQTEEQRQQNAAFLADLEKTRQMESGILAPDSETEAMLLTTWKLEQDLAEVEARIQKNAPQAQLTESIRKEQEQPAEMETKKSSGGLFSSMLQWVRKTFSANPKKVAAKARAQKLKEKETAYALFQEEKKREDAANSRLLDEKGPVNLTTPKQFIEEDFAFWRDTYINQGWCHSGKSPTNAKGELDEKVLYQQISAFIREMNTSVPINQSKRKNAEGKDVFTLNVGEFSQEDLRFVLSHRNPEGIERMIKPLRDFNLADAINKYPLHTCKTVEEQRDMYEKMFSELHKLQGIVQWVTKFALDVATPEQIEFVNTNYEYFKKFYMWFERLQRPMGGEFSAQQYYENVLKDIPAMEAGMKARGETFPKVKEAERRQYKHQFSEEERNKLMKKYNLYSTKMMKLTTLVEDPAGSGSWREGVDEADLQKPNRTVYYSILSLEEFEKYENGDAEAIKTLAAEVKQFSLVDKEGRPRLLGVEGLDELKAHGGEDVDYYMEMLAKAEKLTFLLKHTPSFAKENPKEYQELTLFMQRIGSLVERMSKRMEAPDIHEITIRAEYALDGDPFWPERMQNMQLNDYDKKHK